METPKKVGAKPKYRENVKTTTLHILIPLEKKDDCIKAINGIVYPFKYQFMVGIYKITNPIGELFRLQQLIDEENEIKQHLNNL